MIYIVALGVGLKWPHKIHFNTQWGGGGQFMHTTLLLAPLDFQTFIRPCSMYNFESNTHIEKLSSESAIICLIAFLN